MKLIFLGTNGWYDNKIGNTVCLLLESKKYYIIFDAGNGIYKLPNHIKSGKPIFIFLSHLHLDHIFGLHILPKFKFKNKINIFCDKELMKPLKKIVDHPYAMPFREMKINIQISELSKDPRKLPFHVEHRKLYHIDPSFGYRLKIDGKIVAYCCDTGVCKNSVYLARNADVLIHECASVPKFFSGKWGHSNPEEAASVAKEARCKKLFLTHFSANKYVAMKDRHTAQKAARKIFKNTFAAREDKTMNI
ncbi:MAG: ribonuclease Z [Candidatus Moranbacteria bacterium]|nr:ribonuclease Z [Candidatus Moranbacteria bacterium]